jgi:hypothetical protein
LNSRGSDNSAASSPHTHTTPGAMRASRFESAPTPSGNKLATMTKNTAGCTTSPRERTASKSSRPTMAA